MEMDLAVVFMLCAWVEWFRLHSCMPECFMSIALLRPPGGLCERSEQRVETARAVITLTVNKESGRAVDAASDSASEILPHPPGMCAAQDFSHQAAGIETECQGVSGQVLILECVLIFEQEVVHLPKASLRPGGFGGLRRTFGMRMHVGHREVAKGEAQVIAQSPPDFFDNRVNFTADGAFEVTVLKQCYGCINGPLDVVAPGEREGEFGCRDAGDKFRFHLASFLLRSS